jgi:hypothetical protein
MFKQLIAQMDGPVSAPQNIQQQGAEQLFPSRNLESYFPVFRIL